MRRLILQGSVFIVIATGLALGFSNCGRDLTAPLAAQTSSSQLESEFANNLKGTDPRECLMSETYICIRRIYGEQMENNSIQISNECVLLDGEEICPSLQEVTLNSAAAKANCPTCNEKYDYEETSCHLKWRDSQGLQSLQYSAGNLKAALAGAYERCQNILEMSRGH